MHISLLIIFDKLSLTYSWRSRCGRADSVMVSHPTGPELRHGGFSTLSTELLTDYHLNSIIKLSVHWCVWRVREGFSGRVWPKKMGSCVFQCDVPHQWIAKWQVGPASVCCSSVGCHVLCLQHGIMPGPVWQHVGQSTTATSRHHRDMTSDVKAMLNHKQTNKHLLMI